MQNQNILIPEKIKVGYQKRGDTYSKKLAYIIYYDDKKKLRKEHSWKTWIDEKLGEDDFENKPLNGFVLNKKTGGKEYGWSFRQTYVRIYDPRGFEIEITISNLLYILENTNSIKGKALEGDFVYGWDGTELILIPVDAPDYKSLQEKSNKLFANETIKAKNLKIGHSYIDKKGQELVFMGKQIIYETCYQNRQMTQCPSKKEHFVFFDLEFKKFISRSSVSKYLIEEISDQKHPEYLKILEFSTFSKFLNKIKEQKTIKITEKLIECGLKARDQILLHNYSHNHSAVYIISRDEKTNKMKIRRKSYTDDEIISFDQLSKDNKLKIKISYLENGNISEIHENSFSMNYENFLKIKDCFK